MKRAENTAYFIYIAGSLTGIALVVRMYASNSFDNIIGTFPIVGSVAVEDVTLSVMLVTLIYGLIVILRLLSQNQDEKSEFSARTAELEVAVVTDPLTGLYNRRYFEDALHEYFVEFNGTNVPLAVLTFDLDHFKRVNDSFGHDVGDVVLKRVAAQLKRLVREHDIVARTGGEEFCIVAPFSDESQIEPFAERIRETIAETQIDVGGEIVRPTVSIGVATTAEKHNSPNLLWKVSDMRLYQAKEQGRNRVCARDEYPVSQTAKVS